MKKLFVLVAAMIALSLVSCSKENKSQDTSASDDGVVSTQDLTDQNNEDSYADQNTEAAELSNDQEDQDGRDDETSSTLDEIKRQSKEAAELIKKSADAAKNVSEKEMAIEVKQYR